MKRADLIAAASLVILLTATYSDLLFGNRVLFARDLATFHYPMKTALRDIVRGGEFPLWNPAFSGGQPAAANPQYEVFYPLQWPIFLFEFGFGFRLHILLHIYLVALGMYALLRSLDCDIAVALTGAIALGWSGPLLSLTNLLPGFFSFAWLPLILLFARRRNIVLAALCVAMQTLICDPASLLVTAVVLIAYAIDSRRFIPAITILIAGLALGAVQLIPAIDFARDTARARGFTYDTAAYWSLPPARLAELIDPHAFGRDPLISDRSTVAALYHRGEDGPFIQSLYCGVLILIAAIVSVFVSKRARIVLILAAVAFLIAFGDHTPLLRVLHNAFLFRSIRFPERFAMVGAFALIVAACFAIQHFERSRRFAFLIAIVVFVDLARLNYELVPRESSSFYDPPSVLRELNGDRSQRIFLEFEWHPRSPTALRYAANRNALHWMRRNALYPRFPAIWHYRSIFERDIDQTNLIWTQQFIDGMWKLRSQRADWAETILPVANVGWRAGFRPFDAEVARHPDPRATEPVTFLRVLNGSPYSYSAPSRIIASRETANSESIDIEASTDIVLTISNTWHKGWRATIDGAPATVERTLIAFQGLRVPRGRHHIELHFRSNTVIAGAIVSALALALLVFSRIAR